MRAQPSTSEDPEMFIGFWPTGWVAANDSAHRACVEIALECQTFAGRRLEKDLHLLQDVISAKAPVAIWNAWLQFWQTAAEDYGAEYSAIAKLAASSIPTASVRARQ